MSPKKGGLEASRPVVIVPTRSKPAGAPTALFITRTPLTESDIRAARTLVA